jgi:CRISPR-associated protein Cas1
LEGPEIVLAQVQALSTPNRLVPVARALIAAKLHNYAALAEAAPERHNDSSVVEEIRSAIPRIAEAGSLEEIRGIEGSAAARWYGRLKYRLGNDFAFERRFAPNAEDPVNVLLNIANTHLYRLGLLAARAAGLAPTLGLFHTPSRRYAALAADLQEPFRHLMERCVLTATRTLKPGQFKKVDRGPFRLILTPEANRQFHALILRTLATCCQGHQQDSVVSYREQVFRTARSLRRHLLNPETPFQPFRHP